MFESNFIVLSALKYTLLCFNIDRYITQLNLYDIYMYVFIHEYYIYF